MTVIKQVVVEPDFKARELEVGDFVREYKRDLFMVVQSESGKYNLVAISESSRGNRKFSDGYSSLRELTRRVISWEDFSLVDMESIEFTIKQEASYEGVRI